MELTCPRCLSSLAPQAAPLGVVHSCPVCQGHATTLALLRRSVGATADQLWRAAKANKVASGLPCPSCKKPMAQIVAAPAANAVELDLCRVCQLLWIDAGEALGCAGNAALADNKTPANNAVSPAAAALLLRAPKATSEGGFTGRVDSWSLLLGILGLPQILSAPAIRSTPWAILSLLVGIAGLSLSAYWHEQFAQDLVVTLADPWRAGLWPWIAALIRFSDPISMLLNLYFLAIFGSTIEAVCGAFKTIMLFTAGAISGIFVYASSVGDAGLAFAGAHGGVAAIIIYYAAAWPQSRLTVLPVAWLGPLVWPLMLTPQRRYSRVSPSTYSSGLLRQWRLPVWGWFVIWLCLGSVGMVWLLGWRPNLIISQLAGAAVGWAGGTAWRRSTAP